MKFCKDCKWVKVEYSNLSVAKCVAPQNMTQDPVSGEMVAKAVNYCSTHRELDNRNVCGQDAKWFEEAPPPSPAQSLNRFMLKWWR